MLTSGRAAEPAHNRATDGIPPPATDNVNTVAMDGRVLSCARVCLTVRPHSDENKLAYLGSDPAAPQVPDLLPEKNLGMG